MATGKSLGCRASDSQRMVARSMMLRSSRMFPGHEYLLSNSMALSEILRTILFCCRANSCRKFSASMRMSSLRSFSVGVRIANT